MTWAPISARKSAASDSNASPGTFPELTPCVPHRRLQTRPGKSTQVLGDQHTSLPHYPKL